MCLFFSKMLARQIAVDISAKVDNVSESVVKKFFGRMEELNSSPLALPMLIFGVPGGVFTRSEGEYDAIGQKVYPFMRLKGCTVTRARDLKCSATVLVDYECGGGDPHLDWFSFFNCYYENQRAIRDAFTFVPLDVYVRGIYSEQTKQPALPAPPAPLPEPAPEPEPAPAPAPVLVVEAAPEPEPVEDRRRSTRSRQPAKPRSALL